MSVLPVVATTTGGASGRSHRGVPRLRCRYTERVHRMMIDSSDRIHVRPGQGDVGVGSRGMRGSAGVSAHTECGHAQEEMWVPSTRAPRCMRGLSRRKNRPHEMGHVRTAGFQRERQGGEVKSAPSGVDTLLFVISHRPCVRRPCTSPQVQWAMPTKGHGWVQSAVHGTKAAGGCHMEWCRIHHRTLSNHRQAVQAATRPRYRGREDQRLRRDGPSAGRSVERHDTRVKRVGHHPSNCNRQGPPRPRFQRTLA